jgi:BirA family transcriptional regulator, biotin operon repressor / biotin---[acetyl-CoA-carboxylase] ligase
MIIGSEYIFIRNLPSTNTYAATLLRTERPPEGTIIHTNYQSEGRGLAKNRWESEDGKNLLFSIILYPSNILPEDQFIISKTISLGIADLLEGFADNVNIKWPNDIYVNNDKIAGILIEPSIIGQKMESVIVGIGMNINQREFKTAPNPISLSLITGYEFQTEEILKKLARCLDSRYQQLLNGELQKIEKDYLDNLYRFGKASEFSDSRGVFRGIIIEVTQSGKLWIKDEAGHIREYWYKEVSFL